MNRESIYKRYVPAIKAPDETQSPGYWFVFRGDMLLTKGSKDLFEGIPYVRDGQELNLVPEGIHYLGLFQEQPCYCVEAPADYQPPEGMIFRGLRPLYSVVDEDIYLLAGKALQINSWNQTNRYCGRCGSPTEELSAERAKKCVQCGLLSFPRLSPAVIIAVIREGKILLAHARTFQGNMYSVLAGFVEPGETLEECVHREILEEVGVRVKNIRYLKSQPWPFPNSLMLGFSAEYESGEISVDGMELDDAGWYGPEDLPENLPSRISIARELIDWYLENYAEKGLRQ